MQHALDLVRPFWPLILALVVWPLVGAALSWWLWWDTPEHWEAYAKAHPGRALAIRALRTVSPHLRKLVVAWRDYASARSSLPPLGIALPAEKTGALAVSETRPSVAPDDTHDTPPDGDAHTTVVPPEPSTPTPAHGVAHTAQVFAPVFDPTKHITRADLPPRDGERGHTSLSALLVAAALLGIVAALGAMVMGCPAVREAALRATPGVPARAECAAGAQRCAASDGGTVPEVCSSTGRWWPALARSADGAQRVCPAGCSVTDAGVAYCAAADGGAL